MASIIACIDASAHADSVCELAAWAHQATQLPVTLLHVLSPHSDVPAKGELSGQIGLGSKLNLLERLTELDEQRGKLAQQKGELILEHGQDVLKQQGVSSVNTLHRRGSLAETLEELDPVPELIVIGKRGSHAARDPKQLGGKLERVARTSVAPILVATREIHPIEQVVLAFDGSQTSLNALDWIVNSPLLTGKPVHLVSVDANTTIQTLLKTAEDQLQEAGFQVSTLLEAGQPVDVIVAQTIKKNPRTLLVMGAYGHSKLHQFLLGSTTTKLLQKTQCPLLLLTHLTK